MAEMDDFIVEDGGMTLKEQEALRKVLSEAYSSRLRPLGRLGKKTDSLRRSKRLSKGLKTIKR